MNLSGNTVEVLLLLQHVDVVSFLMEDNSDA